MSTTSRTVRTPDPSLRSLIITVGESSFASVGGILPKEGTLYSDDSWRSFFGSDYHKEFESFRYVTQLDDTKDGGQLLFARSRTPEDTNKPFRTLISFGNHYWHTILLKLEPVLVRGFPLATQVGNTSSNTNADRYVMREIYIPAATEGTRFVDEEFISDTPFQIPRWPVPIASAVTYDLINRRGGFPECLHDKLIIKAVSTVSGQRLPKQVFPETNFTSWRPYTLTDTQSLEQNCYYRKRRRVFPPAMPDEVIRLA